MFSVTERSRGELTVVTRERNVTRCCASSSLGKALQLKAASRAETHRLPAFRVCSGAKVATALLCFRQTWVVTAEPVRGTKRWMCLDASKIRSQKPYFRPDGPTHAFTALLAQGILWLLSVSSRHTLTLLIQAVALQSLLNILSEGGRRD